MSSRRFFLQSLSATMAWGLALIALGALAVGALFEYRLQPGIGWVGESFLIEGSDGSFTCFDLDQDGRQERLNLPRPLVSLPPSIKINRHQPGLPLSNLQRFLAGRLQLPFPQAARDAQGRLWLAGLSASADTSTVFLTFHRQDQPDSAFHLVWQGPVITPQDHPCDWQSAPVLSCFRFVPTAAGERAELGFCAFFLGWRGVILADLGGPEPVFERFPCGCSQNKHNDDVLQDSLGRPLQLCEGLINHNGNRLGGIDDSWGGLLIFDADRGWRKGLDLGRNHNTFNVEVARDGRHVLLHTSQLFVPQPGDTFNLALYDGWHDHLLKTWRVPDLTVAGWDRRGDPGADTTVVILAGTRVERLWISQDQPVLSWEAPVSWPQLRLLSGWLAGSTPLEGIWLANLDGRQRGHLDFNSAADVQLDSQGEGMGQLVVHAQGQGWLESFSMRPVPVWTRLRRQPATWITAALGVLGLFTVLGFRIHRQERLLRGIVDDNTQAVALTGARGRVLYANRAFDALQADPGTAARLQGLISHLPPGESESLDVGGRWLRWFKRPIDHGRASPGSVLIGFDETAEREANEGRKFRSLAGLITHELKTPMTPIRLGLDQLRREVEQVAPGGRPGLERIMSRMKGELDSMNGLIRQFMRLAGEGQADQELDLRQVLAAALARVNLEQLPQVKLELRLPETPAPLRGDGESLTLAICGLLTNALEAMERKGRLQVALLAARDEEGRPVWRLLIEDSGGGIPPDLRDRIWEPGFSTKPDGYGYGLFFARKVIRQSRGQLRLDPAEDGGTLAMIEWAAPA